MVIGSIIICIIERKRRCRQKVKRVKIFLEVNLVGKLAKNGLKTKIDGLKIGVVYPIKFIKLLHIL